MLRNQLKIVSKKQIYHDKNIVFTNIFESMEEKREKYILLDGRNYGNMMEVAMGLGIEEPFGNEDALNDQIYDYFAFDKNTKYVIVVKNLENFLDKESPENKRYWRRVIEKMVHSFEDDIIPMQGVNRKNINIYLTNDDVDFNYLEEYINSLDNEERVAFGDRWDNIVGDRVLPIGTIVDVRLYFREGIREVKRFMIVERFVETDAGYYQYKGIEYPSNTVYTDDFVLFNGNNIDFIAFEGVTDLYDEQLVDKTLHDLKSKGKELIELPIGINNER